MWSTESLLLGTCQIKKEIVCKLVFLSILFNHDFILENTPLHQTIKNNDSVKYTAGT